MPGPNGLRAASVPAAGTKALRRGAWVTAALGPPEPVLRNDVPVTEYADSPRQALNLTDAVLSGHTGNVTAVAFAPEGRLLATASEDGTARLWRVATGSLVGAPLAGHRDGVRAVAFSPDGRLLASGGRDRTVRLWDPAAGLSLGSPLTGFVNGLKSAAFAPDEPLLASADGSRVRLWRASTERA
ncbi:WD40 repeat domain-containing protein [Kitasatospora sp. NPDC056446]|uniref:WD40 repeat domain-containing protein n=1 Tax=Kitasatospora sp. NPDC056446 TaxID=3345819 RepID=UPI0036B62E36